MADRSMPARLLSSKATSRVRRAPSKLTQRYGHLWFVLPGLLFFFSVMIFPAVFALGISLTSWSGLGTKFQFVGLANFTKALSHWPFYRAALNNLYIFISILAFQHTVGLFIAVQLNEKPRFMQFYRTVLFLPVIISLVSTGFIWTLMLSSNIGFINPLLKDLGLGFLARNWLSDPATALPTVIAVTAWNSLGWSVVLYLAGLQNIPEELKQAAQIDGANGWQVFWRVIFPLLSPSFTSLTVLTFIGTFRTFDVVYVLTGPLGSPAYRTDVLGTLIYRTAFGGSGFSNSDIRMSFAIAMALILFFAMALISWGMIVVLRKREIQS
jgi:raffinose/stachyose/melibiose transport system permease protein